MKRILLLTLALLLLMPVAFAQEEVYMSLFDVNFDGWYARSTGEAQLNLVEGSVEITGRSQDWHSPGRDFSLVEGRSYELSVQVYQNEVPNATLMISVAHSKNGRESYENLARAEVKQGEWTTISGGYLAGDFDRFVLYVETLGAPTLSFRMKGFSALSTKGAPVGDLPSLYQLYEPYFDFGSAITQREAESRELMDFYATQFNILTHGNELKPDFVLDVPASTRLSLSDPTAVAINIDRARPLLDYAKNHGIKVHGHLLVWHNQTPEGFFRENYSRTGPYVSREVMLARLENYIKAVFELTEKDYPGLIVSWDVVNEAIDDNTGSLRQSNWTRVVGEDFINQAFLMARKHAPKHMKLYYNDYSTPYQPKLNGILKLLESLKADSSIDGHGFQCHYHLHTPSMEQLQSAMDKVIALNLRLRMSELDILVDAATDDNFEKQARRYDEIMDLFRDYYEHIDAVHTWGVSDNLSWKAANFPLLFDGQRRPKPAFYALVDPLLELP